MSVGYAVAMLGTLGVSLVLGIWRRFRAPGSVNPDFGVPSTQRPNLKGHFWRSNALALFLEGLFVTPDAQFEHQMRRE